jgi:hypothetical protein
VTYPTGSVKQNPSDLSVAVRTAGAEDSPNAWGVMTVDRGGHFSPAADVADWPDLP